jgi:hypothetical protein
LYDLLNSSYFVEIIRLLTRVKKASRCFSSF